MAKATYTPVPEIPAENAERVKTVLAAISGAISVTEGARRLALSRVRFQTLVHRALAGLIEAVEPKKPGRPATSEVERELREENERLRRQNARLEERVQTVDRMLGVASDLMKGRVKLTGRAREPRPKKKAAAATEPEDPDGPCREKLEGAREMRELGLNAGLAASIVGRSASAVRRWARRERMGAALCVARAATAQGALPPAALTRVEQLVRATNGLMGADSLRHCVEGTTRRMCAAIKTATLRAMESERIAAAERITVTAPGTVRGFDQMYAHTNAGLRFLLFSADGAVQYRTSVELVERYDGESVARAVDHDFRLHGAPLVWRADRASCHEHPDVLAVLAEHKVLLLHGPPRHPRFYGQLERQNREHRAWLDALGLVDPALLGRAANDMLRALNALWRRPTLDWKTAEEVWNARGTIDVDRDELREEVDERIARMRRQPGKIDQRARFAIEAALMQRGLLRREAGGWC